MPSSPVRVAIWVRRLAMVGCILAAPVLNGRHAATGVPTMRSATAAEIRHERTRCPAHLLPEIAPRAGARRADRRAEGALRRALLDRAGGARAARPRRVAVRCAAARRRWSSARAPRTSPRSSSWPTEHARAGDPVRRRLVARRPPARGAGRHQHRLSPHEQGAVGQRRGPDRDRAGRRDAQAAQRRDQGHRPVLPDRPRRRRDASAAWRDARQRHQRRALRHDARERARPRSGDGQRRGDPHRHARARSRRPATT